MLVFSIKLQLTIFTKEHRAGSKRIFKKLCARDYISYMTKKSHAHDNDRREGFNRPLFYIYEKSRAQDERRIE